MEKKGNQQKWIINNDNIKSRATKPFARCDIHTIHFWQMVMELSNLHQHFLPILGLIDIINGSIELTNYLIFYNIFLNLCELVYI